MFSVSNGSLTSISGSDTQAAPDGGVYTFDETNGWARRPSLPLPVLTGGNRAAAVDPSFITFESLITLTPDDGDVQVSGVCTGRIWDTGGGNWDAAFGSCGSTRFAQVVQSVDPFQSRRIVIGEDYFATYEAGAQLPPIAGWEQDQFDLYQRFTAHRALYLRSGKNKPTRILDLLNLKDSPVQGADALLGFAAATSDGDSMWLYGYDADWTRRLYRIDPEARTASAEDPEGLPQPATAFDAQDVLVADGSRLWVARFSPGAAIVSTRTAAGAHAHKLEGDVAAALALFEPVEQLGKGYSRYNGFLPPEPLVAFPWGDGRVLVARQAGLPKAVLLSLCEQ